MHEVPDLTAKRQGRKRHYAFSTPLWADKLIECWQEPRAPRVSDAGRKVVQSAGFQMTA
jgi:hypothetical protein